MKTFFKNASKVSLTSLFATIIVSIALICLLMFVNSDANIIQIIAKVFIAISLPFLMLNPLFGFSYSFFIKDKIKILYILLHLACICTISVIAFLSFMFRYFVPFGP